MVYRLKSSKEVISKIFADLDIKEGANRISDIIEWIGEANEKIGSIRQLIRKVSGTDNSPILKVINSQCGIPSDLFRLNQVAYSVTENGPWFPMKLSTSNFNVFDAKSRPTSSDGSFITDDNLIEMVKILYGKYVSDPIYSWFSKMDYKTALDILNSNDNVRTLLTNMIRLADKGEKLPTDNLKYSVKPGFINTNMPSGYLKLSYDAIPLDEDGFPLVPDMASYSEAIYWYVVMKLKYPEYMAGRMNREIYYDMRRSWNFYCKQAYAESMMPSADEMESIKNSWNTIMPNMSSHNSYYSDLSDKQIIYDNTI